MIRSTATAVRALLTGVLAILLVLVGSPLPAGAYLSTAPTAERAWYWQNPSPQGNQLLDSSFVTPDTGWAVGLSGTLLATDSGGAVWEAQDAGTTEDLLGVSFVDEREGWAVGTNGTIVHTSDGGITWVPQASGTTQTLHAVDFFDADTGVAVGNNGTVVRTTDGGSTWVDGSSGTSEILYGVSMATASTGWAVGSAGTIRRTTNGGASWTSQKSPVSAVLNAVYAIDSSNVVAVGMSGYVVRSTNGGGSWSRPSSGTSSAIYDVGFANASEGWCVGASGAIRHTTDGGATWTAQNSGTVTLRAVSAASSSTAHAFGDYGASLATTDGGFSWQSEMSGTSSNINSVDFVGMSNGWAVGAAGTVLKSDDGGDSWDTMTVGSATLYGVDFIDDTHGIAVGASGRVITTDDGGSTWTPRTSGVSTTLRAVCYADADTAWAVGDSGRILKTTDGGATWSAQTSGTGSTLYAVDALDASTVWVAGASGVVRKTTGGGASWASVSSGTSRTLRSIDALDATHVYVAGTSGTLRYTANGGGSWTARTSGTSSTIYAVSFGTSQSGWFVATGGLIRATTNGGTSWSTQTSNTTSALYDIHVADDANAWAVGASGTVRHTNDAGGYWRSLTYGTVQNLADVTFVDPLVGWAVGAGGTVRRTRDGGLTWRGLSPGTTNTLYGVAFTSADNGVVVGASGTIRTTANGGNTWTTRSSGISQSLEDVAFFGSSSGIAVGDAGHILTTADGGATWTRRSSGTNVNLNGIAFLDATHAWAVGDAGTVLSSSNAGQTWTSHASGTTHNLQGVVFSSTMDGCVVGDSGTVRTTTNGGTSWSARSSGTTRDLTGIFSDGADHLWACGTLGTVLASTDGGATWAGGPTGVSTDLTSVSMASPSEGWIVGDGGTILSTTMGAAPATTATLDPDTPDGENGWFASPVTLSLQRDIPGVTHYSTASGDGPWSTYTGPLSFGEGYSTVYYYSTSTGGVTEPVQSVAFKIDLGAPTTPSVVASATSPSQADVVWSSSTDAVSGVDYYEVFVNGSLEATSATNAMQLSGLAPSTLYAVNVVAVDGAGNRSGIGEAPLFATLPVDTSSFVTMSSVDPADPDGENGWYRTAPAITLSSDPAAVIDYSWQSGSGPWETYGSPITAPAGATTLYFYARDPAAVREDEDMQSLDFQVDTHAPAAPANLIGNAVSATSVHLVWDFVTDGTSGLAEYNVYQLVSGDWQKAGSSTEASITIGGLDRASSHTFRVTALDNAGNESDPSGSASVELVSDSPANPPELVAARAVSGRTVYVSWSEPTSTVGTVTYNVWRSEDAADYVKIGEVAGAVHRSYVDDQVSSTHDYLYKVSVVDDRGEGPMSEPSVTDGGGSSARTYAPDAPTALQTEALADGSVRIDWTAAKVPNLAGYFVERAMSQGGEGTTLTAEPVTETAYTDATTIGRPYQRYWYRVYSVDDKGVVGDATIDAYVRTVGVEGAQPPHATFAQQDSDNCNKCHSLHGSEKSNHLLVQESATALCDTCHDGTGAALSIVNDIPQDGTGSSHGMGTRADPGKTSCTDCHDPHFSGAVANMNNLLASKDTTGGVEFCYTCHGEGSTAPGGDMTSFEKTGHNKGISAPNGTSDISCTACHQSHGSASKALLTENADYTTCLQCHSPSGGNPDAPDKQFLLAASDDANAHLPILKKDQEATGAKLSCSNCHNPHRSTPNRRLVDPYEPEATWTGGDNDFCLTCHRGDPLPTQAQVGDVRLAPLGTGGVTVLANIAESYLATNSAEATLSPHGAGNSEFDADGDAALYLRDSMGYQPGDVLKCETCHEHHGGANAFALRGSITSVDGSMVQNGLVVLKLPNDGGYDMRFFCFACHKMNASEHPTGPLSAQPMDCTGCHSHLHGGM